MAFGRTGPRIGASQADAQAKEGALPWYVWACSTAVTSTIVGLYWDISWHSSIGRDTFWAPPHLAIQFGAIVSGITCAYLIVSSTFAPNCATRNVSLRVWGFRAPLGAFLSLWGGAAMLVSVPFDNWWHLAFGLDVQIVSPPHMLLALGILAILVGAEVFAVTAMNRGQGVAREKLCRMSLYLGAMKLVALHVLILEYTDASQMHTPFFYSLIGMLTPAALLTVAVPCGVRWSATKVSAVYTVLWILALWLIPLAPAEPKLGPVYTRVTHLVALGFPLLFIFGAAATDLSLEAFAQRPKRVQAVAAGTAFFFAMLVVQWLFAYFLVSPLARNSLFGMNDFGYMIRPSDYHLAYQFKIHERTRAAFWSGMLIAYAVTVLSTRLGLAVGGWMRHLRR